MLQTKKYIHYADYLFRLIASLIAALIIIPQGEKGKWYTLFSQSGYLRAYIASVIISLLVLYVLFLVNKILNNYVLWFNKPIRRAVLQFIFGFILPLGIAIGAAAYYFSRFDLYLTETTYFEELLFPIAMFILLANFYYVTLYLLRLLILIQAAHNKPRLLIQESVQVEPADLTEEKSLITQLADQERRQHFEIPSSCNLDRIQYIFSLERSLWYYQDGAKAQWLSSLTNTIAELPATDFFQINKSCIIHRDNIFAAHTLNIRNIELLLTVPSNEVVIVAKKKKKVFQIWYNEKVLPPRLIQNQLL